MERAHRTHTEEFYEVEDFPLPFRGRAALNQALLDWERIYNTIRPHQALDGRAPLEYLRERHPDRAPKEPALSLPKGQLSHM